METAFFGLGSTRRARLSQSAEAIGAASRSARTALRMSESLRRASRAQSGQPKSIMVTGLKKINGFVADAVYQPMFLRDAPRPTTCQQISERFGLARTLEWIANYRFDQIQHSGGDSPVGFDPVSQVFPKLRMEDRDPLTLPWHRASLAAIQLRLRALYSLARPGVAPPANAARSVATGAGGRSR